MDKSENLIDIFEEEFGRIKSRIKSSYDHSVQIVNYEPKYDSLSFISSLGLHFRQRDYRWEWFMEFSSDLDENSAASVFDHYLSLYLSGKTPAPKRGSYVLFPKTTDRVWKQDNSAGLYFANPVFRSEHFKTRIQNENLVLVWVVPITFSEAKILNAKGWQNLRIIGK